MRAYNILIGNFINGVNTNMTFDPQTHVWSQNYAFADAQLDTYQLYVTLQDYSNVTVGIGYGGDNTFSDGAFSYYTSRASSLNLEAAGSITISRAITARAPINYNLKAIAGDIRISGSGLKTHGGSWTSSCRDFTMSGSPLTTSGGAVSFNHTGTSSISVGGVNTGGGNFKSRGAAINVIDSGLQRAAGMLCWTRPAR